MKRAAWILALAAAALLALAEPTDLEVQDAVKRDFKARGIVPGDAVVQDAAQRICTKFSDNPPAELAKTLEAQQLATVKFPADGKLMGDWKAAERVAQSGVGMTWSDRPGTVNGGGCYNCHQLAAKEISFGTLGPSLRGFGKTRGSGPDMQRYVYGKLWNSKAYSLCSQMPRFGHTGSLTEQQIKDLVAYLLDPASPVNQ